MEFKTELFAEFILRNLRSKKVLKVEESRDCSLAFEYGTSRLYLEIENNIEAVLDAISTIVYIYFDYEEYTGKSVFMGYWAFYEFDDLFHKLGCEFSVDLIQTLRN